MRFKYWKRWIPGIHLCLMAVFWLGLILPGPVIAQQDIGDAESIGICPQPRNTVKAPEKYLKMVNPLEATPQNILAGKTLFYVDARPTACRVCHGINGDGFGVLFHRVDPKPRNFTCSRTMDDLADGQLFWIIKNGSPGTDMPSFSYLEDDQVWELILFLRKFSNEK